MMTDRKLDSSFSASREDLRLSWEIFRENWKPFIKNELFVVLLICIVGVFFMIFFFLNPGYMIQFFTGASQFSYFDIFLIILLFVIAIALFFLPFAFLTCQFGLAYDIMSSGDMFAEFEGSFTYFKRHWWQYSILALLTPVVGIFSPLASSFQGHEATPPPVTEFPANIVGGFILLLLYLLWFIIFISTLPSITALGQKDNGKSKWKKFRQSFSESWGIFKNNKKRLYNTWFLFFFVFNLPAMILSFIWFGMRMLAFPPGALMLINLLWFLTSAIIIMISYPMQAIIATRIYNLIKT